MTTDDILRMALEADAFGEHGTFYTLAQKRPEVFVRFAALAATKEREACAQVCDAEAERALFNWRNDLPSNQKFWNGAEQLASVCAAAIRARGAQGESNAPVG